MVPVVMPTYARADLAFERGEGAYLYATDGRRFLDFGSGVAVTALGHAHPRLVEALRQQVEQDGLAGVQREFLVSTSLVVRDSTAPPAAILPR